MGLALISHPTTQSEVHLDHPKLSHPSTHYPPTNVIKNNEQFRENKYFYQNDEQIDLRHKEKKFQNNRTLPEWRTIKS
jgi:hypothetical protein